MPLGGFDAVMSLWLPLAIGAAADISHVRTAQLEQRQGPAPPRRALAFFAAAPRPVVEARR